MTTHSIAAFGRQKIPVLPGPGRYPLYLVAVLALVLGGLALTAPPAHAEPIGDIISISDVKKAAAFIQEHNGEINTGSVAAGVASGYCGQLAPGCVTLVGALNGAYQLYSEQINNAARDGTCLKEYFGDDIGDISGVPYLGEYDGPACHQSGDPVPLTDEIMNGGGG